MGKRNSLISIREVALWFVEEEDEPDILRIGQKEAIADHAHAKAFVVGFRMVARLPGSIGARQPSASGVD